MAVKIQVEVFWVSTPCVVMVGYQHFGCHHEDGRSMDLLQRYTASQPRRPRLEWEEAVVAFLRYYPSIFLGKLRKITTNLSHESRSPCRDSNPSTKEAWSANHYTLERWSVYYRDTSCESWRG
jgi:hypothetical protein